MVLHPHVLAFDVAGFAEAFLERGHLACGAVERPAANQPDHRHRRLLRVRGERQCNRTGEQRYELAPLIRSPRRLWQAGIAESLGRAPSQS
jgi:hypothetical protein